MAGQSDIRYNKKKMACLEKAAGETIQ